ncbi:hypothetical protein AVEN_14363-1 [Araneus ventricosus]|uniref:Uncharacterized protein n=1 Tax=Araneus ventricosus TaxID=182803 RepID=A0A4Y2SRJ8_ARAVE|nr:hypothetical protein AVEN_14363-1 [Araneus ventricosus]
MNSDSRNFSINQESPFLPSTFHSNQENEFVQFNQVYHKNFRYTQESSEVNNESLYRQNIFQPGSFQQIQNNCGNNFEVISTESEFLQPKAKNLSSVSEELGNSRNRLHKNRNFIDCEVSNRNFSNDSSGTLNFRELQSLKMQYQAKDNGHTIPEISMNGRRLTRIILKRWKYNQAYKYHLSQDKMCLERKFSFQSIRLNLDIKKKIIVKNFSNRTPWQILMP